MLHHIPLHAHIGHHTQDRDSEKNKQHRCKTHDKIEHACPGQCRQHATDTLIGQGLDDCRQYLIKQSHQTDFQKRSREQHQQSDDHADSDAVFDHQSGSKHQLTHGIDRPTHSRKCTNCLYH